MRKLRILLLCLLAAVGSIRAETPKWAELRALIGATKRSPEFLAFAASYGLTERPRIFGNASRPEPPFFANDSGVAVFVDAREVVYAVLLSPRPVLDLSSCLPIPAGAPPTRAAVLSSLELAEAAGEDRGGGTRAYFNQAWGVGIMYRGDQPQEVYFYPSKSVSPKTP